MAKAKARATKLQDEYLQILGEMSGDAAGREAGDAHLEESYGKYDNLKWATNPLIFDAKQYEMLDNAATTFSSIMEKVMARYQRDPFFRKLFGLPTKVEHLTRVPSGCHAAVPLARLDVFYDPVSSNFHIAGVATGGVDGMATSLAATRAVKSTGAYRAFAAKHSGIEDFDPLTACLKAGIRVPEDLSIASYEGAVMPETGIYQIASAGPKLEKTLRILLQRLSARGKKSFSDFVFDMEMLKGNTIRNIHKHKH